MNGAPDFIGAGWAFPVRTDATGGIALVVREREVEQAIRLILQTSPGERPMRPEFGCRIGEYVFSPANAGTAGMITYEVRRALDRWEPRIEVENVTVSFDATDLGKLYVDVQYSIRATNDVRNLVFPFYVLTSEPDALAPAGVTALETGA